MKIASIVVLLLAFTIPVTAAEKKAPARDQRGVNTAELRLLLNSFTALGEGHIERVLRGLELMAATEEARSGEWEQMKGMLARFAGSGIDAAVVWFALPDGSYYSVKKGLTGLNLRYRDYFPKLMAGREIVGDLVLSESTGRRSAIVAVPIKKDGRVIGALGTSLSVGDISRMIDKEMGLPSDLIFYALDKHGRTCLHRVSILLFAYPSDMGSKSLTKTVKEMLAEPEGTMTYDFYGERTVVFKKSALTGWVYAVGVVTGKPGRSGSDLPPILSDLAGEITAELNKTDKAVAGLAERLSKKDFKDSETRAMLGALCRSYPYAVDCAFVDVNGKMVLVGPKEYEKFEGSDISRQEQIVRLRKTKKPVLSNAFKSVEGHEAVDLQYPLFSSEGDFRGSVSMLIRPYLLLSDILTPVLRGMPVEAFVMQKDGMVLYDQDRDEVGRMLFTDPLYEPFPQLRAVGSIISREEAGAGSYEFKEKGTGKLVKKDAHWTTVGLHGTEWRLVVMHVRAGHSLSSGKATASQHTASYHDALRALAKDSELKKALAGNEIARIRNMFRDFYSDHGGLYSVQWIDSGGMNRYGYPEENSLINLDVKTLRTPSAKALLKALSNKKESTFERPLVEGKTGTFFMVPVYSGSDYLGMIYTIQLKE